MNFQTEYRLNSFVLSTIFSTAIYKNKCQIFFFKCHVLVTKGFSNDIYALPRSKVPLYVQNLVFILLMKAALRFGLVLFLDCIFVNGCAGIDYWHFEENYYFYLKKVSFTKFVWSLKLFFFQC